MLILGIDASGHTASAALLEDGLVLAEYSVNIGLTHSQTLLPMVAEIFSRTGKTPELLSAIAVSSGPGSFTGLRIGAATAKGLALPYHTPLLEVSTLQSLAMNVPDFDGIVHPIMDARRQQVYTGAFREGRPTGEEEAIAIEALTEKINQAGGRHLFLGDGVPVYRDYLEKSLKVEYRFASVQNNLQRASSAALIGSEMLAAGESVRGAQFRLSYIRKPQAEREREETGLREFDITHTAPDALEKGGKQDLFTARNYAINENASYENSFVPENI